VSELRLLFCKERTECYLNAAPSQTPTEIVPMTVDRKSSPSATPDTPRQAAQSLIRTSLKGALATLDGRGAGPYASLVLVAATSTGEPVFLLSQLARHTRNILGDGRASLLLDGTDADGDPMAGARVSLTGVVRPTSEPHHRRRFLARHPIATGYANFPDFGIYTLSISEAHLIQGFGRIIDVPGPALLDPRSSEEFCSAEQALIDDCNALGSTALHRLAGQHVEPARATSWRVVGIDAMGFDMVGDGIGKRLGFQASVSSCSEARAQIWQRLATLHN
jgi:heme iron utilization protein